MTSISLAKVLKYKTGKQKLEKCEEKGKEMNEGKTEKEKKT